MTLRADRRPPAKPRRPLPIRILQGFGLVILIIFATINALSVLGVVFPRLPLFGVFGSSTIGAAIYPTFGLGIVLIAVTLLLWWGRFRKSAIWLTAATLVIVVCSTTVLTSQVGFAASRGVSLSVSDITGSGTLNSQADYTFTYATVDGTPLQASIWEPNHTVPTKPTPAVIWMHGGGFTAGSRAEQAGIYQYLADNGYPVITIDYRLAPPARWQEASSDVVCALSSITAKAGDFGVDPQKFILAGGSAGGSLSLNVAYGLKQGALQSSCGGDLPAAPAAVAGYYPASDLVGLYDDNGGFGYSQQSALAYTGGTPSEFPDRYAFASASTRVVPGLMPTLLVTGANDHLIFESRVQALADALAAAGNSVDMNVVPYADHAYDGQYFSIGNAISRTVLLHFLTKTVPLP